MLFEVEQAIWAVQQPPSAPPIVTRICMHCQRPLTEEKDLAFCTKCLNEPKPIREHVLVISIDGKSTLNNFIELQLWKMMDTQRRMQEQGLDRFLVVFLEEKMKEVAREEKWQKHRVRNTRS